MNGFPLSPLDESPLNLERDQQLQAGRAETFPPSVNDEAEERLIAPCSPRCSTQERELNRQIFEVWD